MHRTSYSSGQSAFARCVLPALLLSLLLAACATVPPADDAEARADFAQVNDPLEPLNRVTFGFNRVLGQVVLEPTAKVYRAVLPVPVRDGLRNALHNLGSPVILANDLLQGEGKRAGNTFLRFLVNSTLGIAGLFDVAKSFGMEGHDEDFGQTLAVWGAGEGPYLVLPVFGPSSPRDGIGMGVDLVMDPFFWIIRSSSEPYLNYVRAGVEGIDLLERNLHELEELERSSIDYYAAMRTRYRENRRGEIRNNQDLEPELPDYLFEDEFYDPPPVTPDAPDAPDTNEQSGAPEEPEEPEEEGQGR
ncbi:MAG: VacJ family lipoprotein [Proteobacteria bacterium]|nr:VacJ family lipoprotein [Pseudomonadota bacterium]